MFTVCEMIELTVHLQGGAGPLGKFMASATSCRAPILACCSYCDRSGTVVRLVTEDAKKTAQALAAEGISCTRDSVVLIQAESSPTAAARMGTLLALTNIPVLYSYSSWNEEYFGAVVFKTADDARAARLLQTQAGGAASHMPDSRDHNKKQCGVTRGLQAQAA